jgi:hypothetical protein
VPDGPASQPVTRRACNTWRKEIPNPARSPAVPTSRKVPYAPVTASREAPAPASPIPAPVSPIPALACPTPVIASAAITGIRINAVRSWLHVTEVDGETMSSLAGVRILPVALREAGRVRAYYAVGRLVATKHGVDCRRVEAELRLHVGAALRLWQKRAALPYAPECLTVNLGNRCNLNCGYCFSAHDTRPSSPVLNDTRILTASANLVARHCREKVLPFQLVVHGGGEPTDALGLLRQAMAVTRMAATNAGVGWHSYIATPRGDSTTAYVPGCWRRFCGQY